MLSGNQQNRDADLQELMSIIIAANKRSSLLNYILIIFLIVSVAINICLIISFKKEMNFNHTKILKKIDHRYFNLTRTLEDIHKVKVNTKDGHLLLIAE